MMNIIPLILDGRYFIRESATEDDIVAAAKELASDIINDSSGEQFEIGLVFMDVYGDQLESDGFDYNPLGLSKILENPEWSEVFERWVIEHAGERVIEAYNTIMSSGAVDGNDNLILYRMLTAPKNWIESGGITKKPVGIYWSFEKDAAEAHWGEFGPRSVSWRLKASVSQDSVDWRSTLIMYANPSYEYEKEVRLKPGAPLVVMGVEELQHKDGDKYPDWVELPDFTPVRWKA